ncbi:unnamed protein product [Brachionus calyciflorus]|uniref:ENTH domain-containing protein n=1 Tax=Brachionus calyciflorus TaxID=104777 RepID=A0A814CQ30_9BILA|nr:unnamed protein product [Brachionus calyciflorus]
MDAITNLLPMWKIKELKDKVTNVVMNYTEVEVKVREATNDDAWGPHGSLMQEIAQYTLTYEHYSEVMGMLWKRMFQENKENWRNVYKSLLLLSHLVKNGSEKCVTSAREHLYDLRSLETFAYVDDNGKDQGINVRIKTKEIIELIQDDDRIREERKKAKKNREKFSGYSTSSMSGGFSSSSSNSGSRSYNDFSSYSSKSTDLDDKDWRGNTPSISDRISDLKSKVKDIVETSTNSEIDQSNNKSSKHSDTIYSDSDEEHNSKYKNDPFADNLPKRSSTFSNKLDSPSKSSTSIKNVNKPTTKIEPIKLKTNFVQNKTDNSKSSSSNTNKSTPSVKAQDLFSFDAEPTQTTTTNNQQQVSNDEFADFGDFVTPASTAAPTTVPLKTQSNIDLFDFDSIQPVKQNIVTSAPIQPVKPQTDIDSLFSVPSNEPTGQADLFQIFSSNPTPQPTPISNSFTMPNISTNQWTNTPLQSTVKPVQTQLTPKPQTNSMWDKLGQSVDINLDNLTPYSKGLTNKTNQNIPMKDLMSQNVQSPKVLTSPPMSPNSRPIQTNVPVQNIQNSTQVKSNLDSLFDF